MSTHEMVGAGGSAMSALPAERPEPGPDKGPAPGPQLVPEAPEPPTRRNNGGWALMLFLAGLAGGAWLFQQVEGGAVSGGGPGAGVVRTATVGTGELPETIRLGGTIAAQEFATIRAPQIRRGSRGGASDLTLIEMAEPGSTVTQGQVVARFDLQSQQQQVDDQEAAVVQATSQIESQRAQLMIEMEAKRQELVNAKAEYEKAKLDLRTKEVVSAIQAEILHNTADEAEATYEQLQEEVALLEEAHGAALRALELTKEQEEVDLKRALLNAEHMVIKTPIPGIVVMQTTFRGGTFSQTSEGDEVNPGTYFMQIVDPSSMVLEAQVNQADSQRVQVGMPATVRLDAYPDEAFEGRVTAVAAVTGGGGGGRSRTGTGDYVRNINVTISILESDSRIIPDLSASADIVLNAHPGMLIAPREALEQDGEQWMVRVREGAQGYARRPVTIGLKNDTHVAVTEGLVEGDVVALEPVAAKKN